MRNDTLLVLGFLLISIMFTLYYIYGDHKSPFLRCRLKTVSSFCFVCFGAFSYAFGASSNFWIMMLGLGFGMAGDVLLDLAVCYPQRKEGFFLSGLFSFLFGHLAYAYCFMNAMHWIMELTFCIVLAIGMIAFFRYQGCVFEKALVPVTLYSMVILFMIVQTGKLVYFDTGVYSIIVFVAALLFGLSDFLLSFLLFQDRYHRPSLTWMNLTTYYMAQFLLAGSLYLLV